MVEGAHRVVVVKAAFISAARWQSSEVSNPDREQDGSHVRQCEEDLTGEKGGRGASDSPPGRLVVKAVALAVVKPLILLRPPAPGSVFVPAEEAQTETGAGSSQDPSGCSRPLQAWLGEASALRGRLLVAVFLSASLERTSALAGGRLHTRAHGCHQQQPSPEEEQLLLAGHWIRTLKNTPTGCCFTHITNDVPLAS